MRSIASRVRFLFVAIAIPCLIATPSRPQQANPQIPTNLISPPIPYDEAIANIVAQDAARPKAAQPKTLNNPPPSPDLPMLSPIDNPTPPSSGKTGAPR